MTTQVSRNTNHGDNKSSNTSNNAPMTNSTLPITTSINVEDYTTGHIITLPEQGSLGLTIRTLTNKMVIVEQVKQHSQGEKYGIQLHDILCRPPPPDNDNANGNGSAMSDCIPSSLLDKLVAASKEDVVQWVSSSTRPIRLAVRRKTTSTTSASTANHNDGTPNPTPIDLDTTVNTDNGNNVNTITISPNDTSASSSSSHSTSFFSAKSNSSALSHTSTSSTTPVVGQPSSSPSPSKQDVSPSSLSVIEIDNSPLSTSSPTSLSTTTPTTPTSTSSSAAAAVIDPQTEHDDGMYNSTLSSTLPPPEIPLNVPYIPTYGYAYPKYTPPPSSSSSLLKKRQNDEITMYNNDNNTTILQIGTRIRARYNQQTEYSNGVITNIHYNTKNKNKNKNKNNPTNLITYDIIYDNQKVETFVARQFIRIPIFTDPDFKPPDSSDKQIKETEDSVVMEKIDLDWNTTQTNKELDDIFEQIISQHEDDDDDEDNESLQMVLQLFKPNLNLFTHQRIGMKWLYKQEMIVCGKEDSEGSDNDDNDDDDGGNPFYVKRTKNFGRNVEWYCSITDSAQRYKPLPIKGSILADEMGLGKTIQTLGLILLAPPNGHRYSIPTTTTATKKKTTMKTIKKKKENKKVKQSTVVEVTKDDVGKGGSSGGEDEGEALSKSTVSSSSSSSQKCQAQDPKVNSVTLQAASCNDDDDDDDDDDSFMSDNNTNEEESITMTDAEEEEEEEYYEPCIPTKNKIQNQTISTLKKILKEASISLPHGQQQHEYYVTKIMRGIELGTILADYFPPEMTIRIPKGTFCTLIVCPPSVIGNWSAQIEEHVKDGVLNVALYCGTGRTNLLPDVERQKIDVLIVSYQTLVADYNRVMKLENNDNNRNIRRKRIKRESIYDIKFHRIVLDEAHQIRNKTTKTFKAVTKIEADRKLALTGTPFVNRADDVYSLMSFLEIEPLCHQNVFRRGITQPLDEGLEIGLTRLRAAMAHIAIRRSKELSGIKLPEKRVEMRSIEFPVNSAHKKAYDALFGTTRLIFETLSRDEEEFREYFFSILEKIMRLRQSCCSGQLVPKRRREIAINMWESLQERQKSTKKLTENEGIELLEMLSEALSPEDDLPVECAVCYTEMSVEDSVILKKCKHVYCEECISRVAQMENGSKCPRCREPFTEDDIITGTAAAAAANQEKEFSDDEMNEDEFGTSPKILALLESMSAMRPDEKGVIFSQFTRFLDLISDALEEKGYTFVRIDGRVSTAKRVGIIRDFNSDEEDSPRFILCSLHAAGTGINLTRANHAFMMDCWWNQAVENQAMDRIHRIGQERDVLVQRFVMKKSIEERMLLLQESKSIQAKGTMEKLKGDESRKILVSALRGLLLLEENTDLPVLPSNSFSE